LPFSSRQWTNLYRSGVQRWQSFQIFWKFSFGDWPPIVLLSLNGHASSGYKLLAVTRSIDQHGSHRMITTGRRFEFVEELYKGDVPAISCDGLVPGSALDLTHWQGNHTPRRYKADTSTEIALSFVVSAEAREQWATALAVNNHFDTDGVLSVWTLIDPEAALARYDLLVAAAEAGDFDEWPALERGLWLDAAIRALGSRAGDDGAAYQAVLEQLPELIDGLDERRDLWGDEWDALQAAAAGLGSGRLRAEQVGAIGVLIHAVGEPEAPGPLLARRFLPEARRYLLVFERERGEYDFRYERPRYAWADTVVRPILAAPDGASLARALGPEWTSEGLPGMTGICGTTRAVADRPEVVVRRLELLDPC
jgi:hypothetical protein